LHSTAFSIAKRQTVGRVPRERLPRADTATHHCCIPAIAALDLACTSYWWYSIPWSARLESARPLVVAPWHCIVGMVNGAKDGRMLGNVLGILEGASDGDSDGIPDGVADGNLRRWVPLMGLRWIV
jgi:hypothetical protein